MKSWIDKYGRMILSAAAVLGLMALTASLHEFQFAPPIPIGKETSAPAHFSVATIFEQVNEIPAWKHVLFWVASFLIIVLVSSLLSSEIRKRLLRAFIRFASFVFILLFIIRQNPDLVTLLSLAQPSGSGSNSSGDTSSMAAPVFQPPIIPPVLVYLASLAVVGIIGVFLWFINRWWQQSKVSFPPKKPLSELAHIARSSISELESGSDWGDVILRCYARMTQVVSDKRALDRQSFMTPAEFAKRLEGAGLPRDPVFELTRLFEFERYGARPAGKLEVNAAVTSLKAILLACGESI